MHSTASQDPRERKEWNGEGNPQEEMPTRSKAVPRCAFPVAPRGSIALSQPRVIEIVKLRVRIREWSSEVLPCEHTTIRILTNEEHVGKEECIPRDSSVVAAHKGERGHQNCN